MDDGKYHIGLCMAGAVSAGAYTAGVMDYLIEALDNWEKLKGKDESIPTHDVCIDVIGGASAGGMTSIIAAIALQKQFSPITELSQNGNENPFFDSWVNLAGKNMMQLMLHNSDLEKEKSVKSIFNSSFIDTIANKTISSFTPKSANRNYVSNNLDVFVTLSNLVGIPYNLRFNANGDAGTTYKMASYRDVGHFNFCGEYANDGRINITGEENENMKILRQCAMATGAFPFGLKYREVYRDIKFLYENEDLKEIIGKGDVDWEKLRKMSGEDKIYRTVNVDGGLMNNEPFEITMKLLLKRASTDLESISNYKNSNGSILMIDPFPTEEMDLKFENDFGLGSLMGKLFSTMRGQLTFKEEEVRKAMDSANASRYMIVPKRNAIEGAKAIACGAFGGFSGFFDYNFRTHDYFLGRYNCRKFLHDVYTIQDPMNNPILAKGYSNNKAQERFFYTDKNTGIKHAPIIPLPDWDQHKNEIPNQHLENWPTINPEVILEMRSLFKKRYRKVFEKSIGGNIINKILLDIGYQVVLGKMITNKTMEFVEKELMLHELIKR